MPKPESAVSFKQVDQTEALGLIYPDQSLLFFQLKSLSMFH